MAQELCSLLEAAGKQVWADWEDIPPTAEWQHEILAGIDAAHAFLALVSPASAGSPMCRVELDHAVRQGKRIVPVLLRPVDHDTLPDPLRTRQWVAFDGTTTPERAAEQLVRALEVDLDWVRQHTRLLTRASEWTSQGQNPSYLMRGVDLRLAEQWLATVPPDAGPKPTSLQTGYVVRSRQRSSRRLQSLLGGVSIGLVAVVVLGVLAWVQRGRAIEAAEMARARVLAAKALGTTADPYRALTMAVEAEHSTSRPLPETRVAFGRVTQRMAALAARAVAPPRQVHSSPVTAAAWSPDGKALATGSTDDTVVVANAKTWSSSVVARADNGFEAVAWSPNGRTLAAGGRDGTARLWDRKTRREVARLKHKNPWVVDLAWGSDSGWLLTLTSDGVVRAWDRRGTALGYVHMAGVTDVNCLAFSPDGKKLAFGGDDGAVHLLDTQSGRLLPPRFAGHGSTVMSVSWSPKGSRLATTGLDGRLRIWDASTGRQAADPVAVEAGAVRWSRHGSRLVTAGDDGTVRFWAAADAAAIGDPLIGHEGPASAVEFSPDGRRLVSAGYDGRVQLWDPTVTTRPTGPLPKVDFPSSVAWSPDGRRLAVGGNESVQLWDRDRNVVMAEVPIGSGQAAQAISWSPDGTRLVIGAAEGDVMLLDVSPSGTIKPGRPAVAPNAHKDYVKAVAWSPDSARFVTGGDDGQVRVWDARTLLPTSVRIPRQTGGVLTVDWSADGRWIAAGGGEAALRVWDAATGKPVQDVSLGTHPVSAIAWSPNGDTWAAGTADGRVHVSAPGRTTSDVLESHVGPVTALDWSPDGAFLASGGYDGTVRLWDVGSGEHVVIDAAKEDLYVWSVRWSPDGQALVASTAGGPVHIFTTVSERRACEIAHAVLGNEKLAALARGINASRLLCADPSQVPTTTRLPVVPLGAVM